MQKIFNDKEIVNFRKVIEFDLVIYLLFFCNLYRLDAEEMNRIIIIVVRENIKRTSPLSAAGESSNMLYMIGGNPGFPSNENPKPEFSVLFKTTKSSSAILVKPPPSI